MKARLAIAGGWMTAVATCFAGVFSQPDAARHPDLFRWTDTCNV